MPIIHHLLFCLVFPYSLAMIGQIIIICTNQVECCSSNLRVFIFTSCHSNDKRAVWSQCVERYIRAPSPTNVRWIIRGWIFGECVRWCVEVALEMVKQMFTMKSRTSCFIQAVILLRGNLNHDKMSLKFCKTLWQLNLLAQAGLVASSFLRLSFGSYFLKPYSHMLPAVLFLLLLLDVHFIFFHELKDMFHCIHLCKSAVQVNCSFFDFLDIIIWYVIKIVNLWKFISLYCRVQNRIFFGMPKCFMLFSNLFYS
jgi:hypothetical protein